MNIQIPKSGIIKEQRIKISKDVSIIYGYNNSGKTTLLKAIDIVFHNKLMENFLLSRTVEMEIYIPTNRVIVNNAKTEYLQLKDCEDFINYQNDTYKDYSLHLKRLRDYLLANKVVYNFICLTIKKIFKIDIRGINGRLSDGIENIINIYLNIIWAMIWDMNILYITEKEFNELLSQKQIYVLIDEIEMFLHVNIQSKLISSLKEDFANCSFILTTHSPLLLTRYKKCLIYNIQNGILEEIEDDVYYEDLDIIYEQLFEVEELPASIREDVNYIGDIILGNQDVNKKRIYAITKKLEKEYPNLYQRYNRIITKALYIGENNDKN